MNDQDMPPPLEVDACRSFVIVPTDPEQPVLGPFRIQDGNTMHLLRAYVRDELGLEEHQYDLRDVLEIGHNFFDYTRR